MKAVVKFKKELAKVRRAWGERQFDRALEPVNRLLERYPDHPKLLIMRSNLVELQENPDGLSAFDTVKQDLEQAAALDDEAPEAMIELGYYYVHEDNAKDAAKYFTKAVHRCVDLFTQALVGHAEALNELGPRRKRSEALMEACGLAAHDRGSVRDNVLNKIKDLTETALEAEPVSANGSGR